MISKLTGTWLLASSALVFSICANAQTTLCTGSGNWLNTSNIILNATCTLENARIRGNITMQNGTLTIVSSIIDGDVLQGGPGDLIITEGGDSRPSRIFGNVTEGGDGDLRILGSIVESNVKENGRGSLLIRRSTVGRFGFYGNAAEAGDGNIFINRGSWVHGNVAEDGPGDIFIQKNAVIGSHRFRGNVAESKSGSLFVQEDSHVAGNVVEDNDGDVGVRSNAYVGGNVAQGGAGQCIIDATATVRGDFRGC